MSGNVPAPILSRLFPTIPEPPFPNPDMRYQYERRKTLYGNARAPREL